jgi:hypothetical protein
LDKKLHQVSSLSFIWTLMEAQTPAAWPQADDDNGDFAVASLFNNSVVRIYYDSGGALSELRAADGVWASARAVATSNSTGAVQEAPPPPGSLEAPAQQQEGLSGGAKAGIGVGVTLGVLALAGGVGIMFFLRRRRQAKEMATAPEMEELDGDRDGVPPGGGHHHTGSTYAGSGAYISPQSSPPPRTETSSAPPYQAWPAEKRDYVSVGELEGAGKPVYEMPAQAYPEPARELR